MEATSIGFLNNTNNLNKWMVNKRMLSRDCDGCSQLKECVMRYQKAKKGDKVYCPDGTAHLIDNASFNQKEQVVCFLQAY